MKERFVHGNKVEYDENDREGVFYLEDDLSRDEADVFFYYARNRRPAPFEDDRERNYLLTYKGSDTFELRRR